MRPTQINDRRLTRSTIEERIVSASAFAFEHASADDANERAQLFIAAVTGFFGANVGRSHFNRQEIA